MLELEAEDRKIEKPEPEVYRAVYRRRGSDLIFAATASERVQVSRYNHRFKKISAVFSHPGAEVRASNAEIKAFLEKEGYKLHEDGWVAADGTLTTEAPAGLDTVQPV